MEKTKIFKLLFGCSPEKFSGNVIITPFVPLKFFEKHCRVEEKFGGKLFKGFSGKLKEKEVTVIRSGVGDSLVGDAVLLLELANVQKVLFTGTCGGLNDSRIGDFLVPESAFDGEGFSKYYRENFSMQEIFMVGHSWEADSTLTELLWVFVKEKAKTTKGKVFTVGSLLAETGENLLHIQKRGFKGIEMELSAFYRAAGMAHIKSAALLLVSDLPLAGEFEETLPEGKLDEMAEYLLEFAVR